MVQVLAMNAKAIGRRLARLEQDARARQTAWVLSLTDDEFDAFYKAIPPDERAAFDAMTDDELERLAAGRMPSAEWQRRLQDARRTNGT
jgi:hypothetical protein